MSPTRFLLAALLALGSGIPGLAQDFHFGGRILVAKGMQDFKYFTNEKLGLGGGLFMDLELQGPHALRLLGEGVVFPRNTWPDESRQWKTLALGLDYLHYPGGRAGQGGYLSVGIQDTRFHQDISAPGFSETGVNTQVGLAFGFGYTFPRLVDLNLRYVHTTIQDSQVDALQLGLGLRF